ncbi:MAG TPA: hypothetical protein DEF45_19230 [Rhodopirellula sp.]|nr:hypothetical protein [Rhodopirellula sp.]
MCNRVFHSVQSEAVATPSHDSQKLTNWARQQGRFSYLGQCAAPENLSLRPESQSQTRTTAGKSNHSARLAAKSWSQFVSVSSRLKLIVKGGDTIF